MYFVSANKIEIFWFYQIRIGSASVLILLAKKKIPYIFQDLRDEKGQKNPKIWGKIALRVEFE